MTLILKVLYCKISNPTQFDVQGFESGLHRAGDDRDGLARRDDRTSGRFPTPEPEHLRGRGHPDDRQRGHLRLPLGREN